MEFSGSFDQFEVIFGPPISTPPDLWRLTKTSVKLCIAFFKSQAQWPKDVSEGDRGGAWCRGQARGDGKSVRSPKRSIGS